MSRCPPTGVPMTLPCCCAHVPGWGTGSPDPILSVLSLLDWAEACCAVEGGRLSPRVPSPCIPWLGDVKGYARAGYARAVRPKFCALVLFMPLVRVFAPAGSLTHWVLGVVFARPGWTTSSLT
eukprot:370214-Pleurochrysis_carterae.AAC.1